MKFTKIPLKLGKKKIPSRRIKFNLKNRKNSESENKNLDVVWNEYGLDYEEKNYYKSD